MGMTLSKPEVHSCKALADETYRQFMGTPGHYVNTPHGHLVGKLGEYGLHRWMTEHLEPSGVLPYYRDPGKVGECDITYEGIRFDVKTWMSWDWEELGRCIRTSQIDRVKLKADVISWMVIGTLEDDSADVLFAGWNYLYDFLPGDITYTGKTKLENYQIPKSRMRAPSNLVTFLESVTL